MAGSCCLSEAGECAGWRTAGRCDGGRWDQRCPCLAAPIFASRVATGHPDAQGHSRILVILGVVFEDARSKLLALARERWQGCARTLALGFELQTW